MIKQSRKCRLTTVAALACIGLALPAADAGAAMVVSTFDTDADGWTATGDVESQIPVWLAAGGNPGGTIEVDDSTTGGVWYFEAPSKFKGDQSLAHGRTLSFDLYQRGSGPQFERADVILQGAGLILELDAGPSPLPLETWQSYSVLLAAASGWTVAGGAAASDAQMLAVLGDLQRLRIRGEFITGTDFGRIDNVRLDAVPVPPALPLLAGAMAALAAVARRRRSGHP
ncbi:MAG: laminin B domain-containing protein [Gammaproteobacteria bacterium]